MSDSAMTNRLVELTEQAMDGDFDALRRILEAAGGQWFTDDADGRNPRCACGHGMMVGIPVGHDPIATYVQVCFAVIGPLWTLLPECMEGQQIIRQRWRSGTKAAKQSKSKRAKATPAPRQPPRPRSQRAAPRTDHRNLAPSSHAGREVVDVPGLPDE